MIAGISGIFFILGMTIGSFLSALVPRVFARTSMMGRSACDHCAAKIAWYDNIPVASFLYLRGTCRSCKKRISVQYPLIEVCMGLLFGYTAVAVGMQWELLRDLIVITLLAFTFLYDGRYGYILDSATVTPAVMLFAVAWIAGWRTPSSMLIGAVIGAGFFLVQYTISHGVWVGAGDIRLGGFMGVILGWQLTLVALFLAYVGGAIVSLVMIVMKKRSAKSTIPFGTFLTLATVAAMYWGQQMLDWYIGLI